ncbi:MAG TPA: YaeQ family protein [Candidatus Polarisedimenticolia bacterium]|nr:YaeQ family protein [Candidatus Polarisedimenticolia bacterium]
MALTATMHSFAIRLEDEVRGLHEDLAFRVARHPSETEASMVVRVLAYGLEYAEGISFADGLPGRDEPAIAVRDLTGALRAWIDVGAPDAARLHRAGKAAPRVVVYTHKDPELLIRQWSKERIHRADRLELYSLDRALREALTSRLERRMAMTLAVTAGRLRVTVAGTEIEGAVTRHPLGER